MKKGFDLKDENGENINIDIDYLLQSTDIDYSVSKKTAISMFSYKTGIVYYDDFNEATTVLSNSNDVENEVYVPFDKRTKINKILAKINHNPPSWATKFKFVVQHQKLNYENVYITYGKKVASNVYLKLDGVNVNKVKKDDKIFVVNPIDNIYREVIVSDVGIYGIEEGLTEKGLYFKVDYESDNPLIITASGLSDVQKVIETGHHTIDNVVGSNNPDRFVSVGAPYAVNNSRYWNLVKIFKSDIGAIKEGDIIRLNITMDYQTYDTGGTSAGFQDQFEILRFNEVIFSNQDYANIYELLVDEFDNPFFDVENTDANTVSLRTNNNYKSYVQERGSNIYNFTVHEDSGSGDIVVAVEPKIDIEVSRGIKPLSFRTVNKETLDTFYYESPNTFKIVNGVHVGAIGGYFDTGFYNGYAWGNGVESYKIKDDFNGNALDFRFRPNGIDPNGYTQKWRKNDITYSGLYNGDFKINDLNLFNPALINWKELPTEYGEIQKIVSTDGDISVFCNDKVINVYYGKSIIADLQGNESVALTNEVLGGFQELGYPFGTQNPESVIKTNEGLVFVDKKRARYLLKSERQIAELNPDGSGHHYQGVKEIKEHNNFLASYNQAHGEYVFGLDHSKAIVFAPSKKGFSHYYDFNFDYIKGMNGKHFTAYRGIVYEDEVTDNANSFAGSQHKEGKLKYVVNPEMGIDKIYKALKLQSNTPWDVFIKTNLTETLFTSEAFTQKESYFFSEIYRDTATLQNSQGIGVIQNIVGNNLEFGYKVGIEVSVGDNLTQENGVDNSEITNVQGKVISVVDASVFSVGDYVLAMKQSNGYYSPDGAVQRGKFMEVTLTNDGSEPYYITSAHTEIIKSNL